jgi:hypothetical protein
MFFALFLILAFLCSGDAFLVGLGQRKALSSQRAYEGNRRLHMANDDKIEVVTISESEEENMEKKAVEIPQNESAEEKYKREKLAEIAERKSKEVFVTQKTGKYECQACGYVYDEAKG